MRWSESFIPTLRDDPADAEAVSHKLLVRAGFVRQLMSGVYSLLPLGHAVARKITGIVRAEMNAIGAQEFQLPALHPAELWQRSGRWTLVGDEMFRLKDRRGADIALGMTHEEVFTTLAGELRSYRQLPQIWYQIQTKFRDEPRPKSGLLRVREFTMKDSYSFDLDARRPRPVLPEALRRLSADLLALRPRDARGRGVVRQHGRQRVDRVHGGERRRRGLGRLLPAPAATRPTSRRRARCCPRSSDGRGSRRARALRHAGRAHDRGPRRLRGRRRPAERQIKTLVYRLDGETVLVLLRGDHALVEAEAARRDRRARGAARPGRRDPRRARRLGRGASARWA